MSLPQWASLLGVGLLVYSFPANSWAQEFQVDLSRENRVSFVSDAPLENFTGVTDRVDGFVFVGPPDLPGASGFGESEFYFEVDLASLDTGIGLRNRHMRDNYLETDRFPFAVYSGRVGRMVDGGGGSLMVVTRGELEIHGVSREREIRCSATPEGGRTEPVAGAGGGLLPSISDLRVSCGFQVALSDHGIPIPKLMFMKIDEIMELEVTLHLHKAKEDAK